jgi:hypothetical protein
MQIALQLEADLNILAKNPIKSTEPIETREENGETE